MLANEENGGAHRDGDGAKGGDGIRPAIRRIGFGCRRFLVLVQFVLAHGVFLAWVMVKGGDRMTADPGRLKSSPDAPISVGNCNESARIAPAAVVVAPPRPAGLILFFRSC